MVLKLLILGVACFAFLQTSNAEITASNLQRAVTDTVSDIASIGTNMIKAKAEAVMQAAAKTGSIIATGAGFQVKALDNAASSVTGTLADGLISIGRSLSKQGTNIQAVLVERPVVEEVIEDVEPAFMEEVKMGPSIVRVMRRPVRKGRPIVEEIKMMDHPVREEVRVMRRPIRKEVAAVMGRPVVDEIKMMSRPVVEEVKVMHHPVREEVRVMRRPIRKEVAAMGRPVFKEIKMMGQPVREEVKVMRRPIRKEVAVMGRPVVEEIKMMGHPVREEVKVMGHPIIEEMKHHHHPIREEVKVMRRPIVEEVKMMRPPVRKEVTVMGHPVLEEINLMRRPIVEQLIMMGRPVVEEVKMLGRPVLEEVKVMGHPVREEVKVMRRPIVKEVMAPVVVEEDLVVPCKQDVVEVPVEPVAVIEPCVEPFIGGPALRRPVVYDIINTPRISQGPFGTFKIQKK